MELSNLKPNAGSTHKTWRKGRGTGSGNGKTAGYGNKGQKARSGAPRPGFEGGQMPLYRRLPKRGFKDYNSKDIVAINVSELNKFDDNATVTVENVTEDYPPRLHETGNPVAMVLLALLAIVGVNIRRRN